MRSNDKTAVLTKTLPAACAILLIAVVAQGVWISRLHAESREASPTTQAEAEPTEAVPETASQATAPFTIQQPSSPATRPNAASIFEEMEKMRQEMNQVFADPFFRTPSNATRGGIQLRSSPRNQMRVIEEDDAFIVEVNVPGVDPADISFQVANGLIEVSGSSTQKHEHQGMHVQHTQRFSQSMRLPGPVNTNDARIAVEGDLVKISLPKAEQTFDSV